VSYVSYIWLSPLFFKDFKLHNIWNVVCTFVLAFCTLPIFAFTVHKLHANEMLSNKVRDSGIANGCSDSVAKIYAEQFIE
jgi:hypothetical protein